MSKQCIKALVSGRVQGVFFRDSTHQQALSLGLTGYAVNLRDGRVEVLACGERNRLEELIRWLGKGPEMAQVTDLEVNVVDVKAPDGFHAG